MNFRNFWTHLRLYDLLTFGYLWLTLLLVAFSPKALPIRERLVLIHLVVSCVIALLIYWGQVRAQIHYHYIPPRWLLFMRDWHPLLWFTFIFFGEFTYLAKSVFPYWIENRLIQFDWWLFGQPPHRFMATNTPAWLVELMAFAYWSYYPLIFGIAVRYYFFRPKNDQRPINTTLTFVDFMNRLCLAFYLCYLLFIMIPARSPRHALNFNGQFSLSGGPFYSLIAAMQNYVSVVGAAFPSSHVAVAWVAVMTLRVEHRLAFWSLTPLVLALTLSIFVLQYHYVLDAVSGVILALVFEWFWGKFHCHNETIAPVTNSQPARRSAAATHWLT